MRVARFLVQGVDVWLNNPRRPLEASGTSGMKAAQNGVPNISVLDGWWDEGFDGDNGWAIGGREQSPDEAAQDWHDAQDLYRLLEDEIVPALLRARRGRRPDALAGRDAPGDGDRALALLDDADAPRVHRAACTCRRPACQRARHGRAARGRPKPADAACHRGSRWRLRSTTTSRSATSAGSSPRSTSRPTLPMLEALERHPGRPPVAPLHRAAARVAARRAPRRSSSGSARSWRATRSRSWAAATTSRSSPRCRSATGSASCARMGDELEAMFGRRPSGAWLAERVWEPDLPTSLAAGRLRLDDPRRRALPRRGHPRGGPLGAVHDRGPGPAADGLRHRAGPPLPDPVPRRRGRHRLPARRTPPRTATGSG